MNNRGYSLAELLIAGVIGITGILAYSGYVNSSAFLTGKVQKRVIAEAYATQLLEVFRSMNKDELKSYLSQNPITGSMETGYVLCSTASKPAQTQQTTFIDPLTYLPADNALGNGAARTYEVLVANVQSMEIREDLCHRKISSVELLANESYLVRVGVSIPGSSDPIVLSSVLPTTPSAAPCNATAPKINAVFIVDNSGSNSSMAVNDCPGVTPASCRTGDTNTFNLGQCRCGSATARELAVLGLFDEMAKADMVGAGSEMALISFPNQVTNSDPSRSMSDNEGDYKVGRRTFRLNSSGSGNARYWLPISAANRGTVTSALQFTRHADGLTPYGTALTRAGELLSGKDGMKVIFFITDGVPSDVDGPSDIVPTGVTKISEDLKRSGIKIYSILYGGATSFATSGGLSTEIGTYYFNYFAGEPAPIGNGPVCKTSFKTSSGWNFNGTYTSDQPENGNNGPVCNAACMAACYTDNVKATINYIAGKERVEEYANRYNTLRNTAICRHSGNNICVFPGWTYSGDGMTSAQRIAGDSTCRGAGCAAYHATVADVVADPATLVSALTSQFNVAMNRCNRTVDPCSTTDPLGLITFETIPGIGTPPTDELRPPYLLNTQYKASHGVSFCIDKDNDRKCDSAGEGSAAVLKSNFPNSGSNDARAFPCTTCPGPRNAFDTAHAGELLGGFFLSNNTVGDSHVNHGESIIVKYDRPVKAASGQIYDLDNDDATIEALGNTGQVLQTVTLRAEGVKADGRATRFAFNRPTADIHSLYIKMSGKGFAFDNFSPSAECPLTPSTPPPGDACDSTDPRGMITFEKLMKGANAGKTPMESTDWRGPQDYMWLDPEEYKDSHGVIFCRDSDKDGRCDRTCAGKPCPLGIASVGGETTAFTASWDYDLDHGFGCDIPAGGPTIRCDAPVDGTNLARGFVNHPIAGSFILASGDDLKDKEGIVIEYLTPVSEAGGTLYDVDDGDGAETVNIEARDINGNILALGPVSRNGIRENVSTGAIEIKHGDPGTGPGSIVHWSFKHATADIHSISIKMNDDGVAFDNFSHNRACPVAIAPVDPCDPTDPRGLITFETIMKGGEVGKKPRETTRWNAQDWMQMDPEEYLSSHGVTICRDREKDGRCDRDAGGKPIGLYYASVGGRQTSFNHPVTDDYGCDTPEHEGRSSCPSNQDRVTPYLNHPVTGSYFLASGSRPDVEDGVVILYNSPVASAGGVVLDVDDQGGIEVVTIEARDATGNVLNLGPKAVNGNRENITVGTIEIKSPDPGTKTGSILHWSFKHATADIHSISIRFTGSGVAFDNFSAAAACPATTPPSASAEHFIFATSRTTTGRFRPRSGSASGLAAADQICQEHGDSSANPNFAGRIWKSVISTSSAHARDRIRLDGDVYRFRRNASTYIKEKMADRSGSQGLFSGNMILPVMYNEAGNTTPAVESDGPGYEDTWSASNNDGRYTTAGGGNACNNWTSNDENLRIKVGNTHLRNGLLSDPTTGKDGGERLSSCDDSKYILCINQFLSSSAVLNTWSATGAGGWFDNGTDDYDPALPNVNGCVGLAPGGYASCFSRGAAQCVSGKSHVHLNGSPATGPGSCQCICD